MLGFKTCSWIINSTNMKKKNLHLILSILIIIPVALIYGLNPGGILKTLFFFEVDSISLSNILKAVMGLYISIALFWLIGLIKPKLWATATLLNILFMGGLVFGRIISIILDGVPSYILLLGLGLEIFLAIWGIINLRIYNKPDNTK